MLSRRTILIGLVAALATAGCGARSAAGPSAPTQGSKAKSQTIAAQATAATRARASKWTIEDLSKAEGRKLNAQLHQGDLTVSPDLTGAEKALLEKLYTLPPGTTMKDGDLAPDHLKRVKMQGEFVYQHDGSFHRAMWRMEDDAGRTIGFRIHSQPSDLMSGKYIVALYSAEARLLVASPIWY